MPGTSVLGEPQFVAISGAAGDNTLVAAQAAGVKIRVLGFLVCPAASAVISFQSGTGGTNLTGAMTITAPIWVEGAPLGIFETAAATLLNLHQTGVVQLSGWLVWCTAT
jgi:hypothetical protein